MRIKGPSIAIAGDSTWFSPRINIPSKITFKEMRANRERDVMRKRGFFLENWMQVEARESKMINGVRGIMSL